MYEIKKSWDWEKLLNLQNFLDHYNTDKISRTENLFWMHQNFAFFCSWHQRKNENFWLIPNKFLSLVRTIFETKYFYKQFWRFFRLDTMEQLKCKKMGRKIGYAIWKLWAVIFNGRDGRRWCIKKNNWYHWYTTIIPYDFAHRPQRS